MKDYCRCIWVKCLMWSLSDIPAGYLLWKECGTRCAGYNEANRVAKWCIPRALDFALLLISSGREKNSGPLGCGGWLSFLESLAWDSIWDRMKWVKGRVSCGIFWWQLVACVSRWVHSTQILLIEFLIFLALDGFIFPYWVQYPILGQRDKTVVAKLSCL